MARTDPQVNLRIPADLKARIDASAEASNRSMNAEVVARLQQSFEPQEADDRLDHFLEVSEAYKAIIEAEKAKVALLTSFLQPALKEDRALNPTERRLAALYLDGLASKKPGAPAEFLSELLASAGEAKMAAEVSAMAVEFSDPANWPRLKSEYGQRIKDRAALTKSKLTKTKGGTGK